MKNIAKDMVTLWQAKKPKNPDVLIAEPSLVQTHTLMAKLKRGGFAFMRMIESSNLEVIASMVASGCGVGILPQRVAEAAAGELVPVKGAPTFNDEIFLIYRMENKNVRAMQALSQAIQEGFAR